MKRKLCLFLFLSAMTHIALATSIISAEPGSIAFRFSQPAKKEIKKTDLSRCGVLLIYVNEKSFGAPSDPVTMTCDDGSEGPIKIFPGGVQYCT